MKLQIKKVLTFLLFTGIIFFMASCEKDVILNLSNKQGNYLIVDANITDDGTRQWIRLSLSTSYYDISRGQSASNANVVITDGENSYRFTESTDSGFAGYYYNDDITFHLENRRFELIIDYNSNTYTANSEWRPLPVIDSISMRLNIFSQLGFNPDTLYDVLVHFRELETPDDFYLFNLFVNDTIRTPRPSDKGLVSDINLTEYVSFAVLNINRRNLRPGDAITLEMRSISRENFEFYNTFFFQTDLSGNPFAGAPPANIPTNISAGGRGFFQVSAVSRKTIIFEPVD